MTEFAAKDEQCESCRWHYDRYCAFKPCDGCERFSQHDLKGIFKDSVTHCQCVAIAPHEFCPHYEEVHHD